MHNSEFVTSNFASFSETIWGKIVKIQNIWHPLLSGKRSCHCNTYHCNCELICIHHGCFLPMRADVEQKKKIDVQTRGATIHETTGWIQIACSPQPHGKHNIFFLFLSHPLFFFFSLLWGEKCSSNWIAVFQIMISKSLGFQESHFAFTVWLVFVLSSLQQWIMDSAGMAEWKKTMSENIWLRLLPKKTCYTSLLCRNCENITINIWACKLKSIDLSLTLVTG